MLDKVFQPTRPLRGTTLLLLASFASKHIFQPTRPLRGTTSACLRIKKIMQISTHAPLAGHDPRAAH